MAWNAEEFSPGGLDLKAVDDAIRIRNWLLRFPPWLEELFERDTGQQRCRDLIVRAFIGVVIYDLFAVADWWAAPQLFWTAFWMRLVFFTPVSLSLIATLYVHPRPLLRESVICIGGVIAGGTIVYLMAVSGKAPQATLHESMTLVVLFLTVVQRIRFSYLAPTCFAFLALHVFAVAHFYDYSVGQQVAINMVFGATVIFALVAAHTMERDLRLHYLLSLRERARNLELDRMSRHDALTGLGNRRALEDTLAACEQADGGADLLSIVLLDIDHFKSFNDTAGHQAGDLCLKRVAGVLQATLRGQADHAFRFGGEELVVVLPKTVLPKALGIAERIRQAIEGAAIPHPGLPAGGLVTASFGVACSQPGLDMRAVDVIADADLALYAAKRNGRNQVWPWPFPATGVETTEHSIVPAA